MKIVVLDGYTMNPGDLSWGPLEALGDLTVHDRTPDDLIVERARGAEAVLTNKEPLSAETLAELPDLKYIGVLATGVNVVDIDEAKKRGIVVTNVPEYSTASVAQFTFALLLALCHHVEMHSGLVLEERAWSKSEDFCFTSSPQIELAGRTLGIIGFGRIGRAVGKIGDALGMRVLANSRSRTQTASYEFNWRDAEEIFAEADVVSLNCPLTDENEKMVNREMLARMKPDAFLVNTARGALVDEAALAQALGAGKLAGAALDVATVEPLPEDSPLYGAPNLILTPHIAWMTRAARRRLMDIVAGNLKAWQNGNPRNVI